MLRFPALLIAFFLLIGAAQAASFRTEATHEAAVREIAAQLRCPVCQSENILDSQSGTAREMVAIVREQLEQGRTQAEIIAYFRQRYGDYVMLSPSVSGFGALVWAVPLVLLVLGGGTYFLLLRGQMRSFSRRPDSTAPHPERLTEDLLKGLEL